MSKKVKIINADNPDFIGKEYEVPSSLCEMSNFAIKKQMKKRIQDESNTYIGGLSISVGETGEV